MAHLPGNHADQNVQAGVATSSAGSAVHYTKARRVLALLAMQHTKPRTSTPLATCRMPPILPESVIRGVVQVEGEVGCSGRVEVNTGRGPATLVKVDAFSKMRSERV